MLGSGLAGFLVDAALRATLALFLDVLATSELAERLFDLDLSGDLRGDLESVPALREAGERVLALRA